MALTYQQLGMTAQNRVQLDEAEDWYRRSLAIKEELGDRAGMASTYGQLGLLAEDRQQPRQALDWTIRCVSLFGQFPHPATRPGPEHLSRLTKLLGMAALEQSWLEITGQPLPRAVRDHLISQHTSDSNSGGTP
jgi:hypothetical protein